MGKKGIPFNINFGAVANDFPKQQQQKTFNGKTALTFGPKKYNIFLLYFVHNQTHYKLHTGSFFPFFYMFFINHTFLFAQSKADLK